MRRRCRSRASAGVIAAAALLVLPGGTAGAVQSTHGTVARWAPLLRNVDARRRPTAASAVIATVPAVTPEGTQNLVLVLRGVDVEPGKAWYRVRLPVLPNNSTGWVPAAALGDLYTVHTHLYVDRATFTATLKRDGRTIFRTRVGIGRASSPTPRGQFYIRSRVDGFHDPFYGPIAFGTNARSPVLTDWPGGGFIGVHGTNRPSLIPGAISHGCIRMVNRAIVRLSRLMPVGTPLTIT